MDTIVASFLISEGLLWALIPFLVNPDHPHGKAMQSFPEFVPNLPLFGSLDRMHPLTSEKYHHFIVRSSSRRTSRYLKQKCIKVDTNLIQGSCYWGLSIYQICLMFMYLCLGVYITQVYVFMPVYSRVFMCF